jgi:hypothetical protein
MMDVFKKKFNTPFLRFPGNDVTLHKAPGEVRSQYFIPIKIDKDGSREVVHSKLGSFQEAHAFLKSIVTASGLK